ncbi:DUF2269 domain-containing protein [Ferrovibrio sp.]|uniref:DUF2269 family protein n=1 Tax=Ferrovibrio sp. TaxID=1917215 RepID=UPI00262EBEC3|nr:DUF2269 domain-containing protein [Ferrovibrio sp.]
MSELYLPVRYLHVLSATVLFGTGLGIAFFLWFAHRSGHVATIAGVARLVVRADWLFTGTAGVVQPASGIALILIAGHDPHEPWLLLSYALYVGAFLCWAPVVWLQLRIRDMAVAALRDGTALPAPYYRYVRYWFLLGWPAFIGLLLVFWLMIARAIPGTT